MVKVPAFTNTSSSASSPRFAKLIAGYLRYRPPPTSMHEASPCSIRRAEAVAFRRPCRRRCRSRSPDRSPMSVAKWSGASLPAVSSLLRSIMSARCRRRTVEQGRPDRLFGQFLVFFLPAPARRRCVVVLPAPRLRRSAALATLASLQPMLTPAQHAAAVARIRDYIAAGDCYQVNFTFPVTGSCVGDPLVLYARLRRRSRLLMAG